MPSVHGRPGPLNVLVVLTGNDPQCTAMLSGLRKHCALVCQGADQADEAIGRGFEPDVAVIDGRLEDPAGLVRRLAARGGRPLLAVALGRVAAVALGGGFAASVDYPARSAELEGAVQRAAARRHGQSPPQCWPLTGRGDSAPMC
jgi:hypothetical protein